MPGSVILIDPNSTTPYYDVAVGLALRKLGWDVQWVTTVCPYVDFGPLARGLSVHHDYFRLQSRLNVQTVAIRRFLKALEYPVDSLYVYWARRGCRNTIVHFQWSLQPHLDCVHARLWKRRNCKIAYTVHNTISHFLSSSSIKRQNPFLHCAEQLFVHSEFDRQRLVQDMGVPVERITVIPLPSYVDFYTPLTPKEAFATRRQWGIGRDEIVFLFFGSIREYKGLDDLLRALSSAVKVEKQIKLLIAGRPFNSFAKYDTLIRELGLSSNVYAHINYIPDSEVRKYFGVADVVVLPYKQTSQSAVALLAYTLGRPVLVTNVGGLPEIVEEGQSGFVVQGERPTALAGAMLKVAQNRERLRRMGPYAMRLAHTRYSPQVTAQRTLEVYRRMIES